VTPPDDDLCEAGDADVGGPTPEQEAEAYAALAEMERDQKAALVEGLRALIDGGADGLVAVVDKIARRISQDGAYALRCAARELHPDRGWEELDEFPHEEDC